MNTTEIETAENGSGSGSDNGRVYLIGAGGGLVLGLIGAYLFIRTAKENGKSPQIKTSEAIKLAVGIITLLRQVAALAS